MIYLDSAATSYYRPDTVVEAVKNAMLHMGNANRGSYHVSLNATRTLYDTREILSEFFHVGNPGRIAFTYNVTHSLNMAIHGLCTGRQRILTTAMEHNSVLRPVYMAQNRGCDVSVLPLTSEWKLDMELLEKHLSRGVDVFVCTHASNVTGEVNDIRRIGELCAEYNSLFILDAAQSAGVLDIDMKENQISVLCFTGHKALLGPQGIGGICVAENVDISPIISGGTGIRSFEREQPRAMPECLEAGTINVHGAAGLYEGVKYIQQKGLSTIKEREQELVRRFYSQISDLPGLKVYGDMSNTERVGILSLNIGELSSYEISDFLFYNYEIMTRSGIHCAPLLHKAAGTEKQGMVRFSFSHFLKDEEVDQAAEALRQMVNNGIN